ncbi:hypothetical protein DL93DRAFT_1104958 [Clavulina sp. PMI_390]|nr:hypothetical protein DL93DRAFT_1104958 [Clavulina sp. PMI_390]
MPNVVSKTPAPYSPLPTEILLIIFAIVCELDPDTIDEYHVPTQLLALTHTCRLFREACIGTPALWTCVPYGWSSALLALWMDRMPTILPLDLMACRLDQPSVDFRTMTAPDQYPRLLATAHRWRSVHLIRCDYASLKRFMTWTDSLLAATHLEELNIRVAPVEVDEPGAFPFSMHHRSFRTQLTSEIGQRRSLFDLEIPLPTTSLFPHLSRLTLYCPPFEFSAASMLSTVVELCIHIPFISEWEVWQSVLLQGISLEYLRITAQCEVDSRITAPVKLPCLRVLDLGIDTHKSFLSSWFRHVTAPELRKLSLTSSRERLWDTDGELISELFEFFVSFHLLSSWFTNIIIFYLLLFRSR